MTHEAPEEATTTDVPAALQHAHERWIEVVEAGDVDAYADLMTTDVVWLPPGMTAIQGREPMRQWLGAPFARVESRLTLDVTRRQVHGDWAVEEGRFLTRMVDKETGSRSEHGSRYMAWWQQVGDDWLLDRYVDLGDGA